MEAKYEEESRRPSRKLDGDEGSHKHDDDDGEDHFLALSPLHREGRGDEGSTGFSLDFGAAVKTGGGRGDGAHSDESKLSKYQTSSVRVVFELPDGSQADQEFKLGQTVELLKSYVEAEFGIPMAEQDLYLGSKRMMDPLQLLDYPEIDPAEDLFITVQGEMEEGAKK